MKTFKNRIDAASHLAKALGRFKTDHPLVLAIPRGAVPMARVIALELGADLDVLLVQQIYAPGSHEYAIGAVSELGDVFLNETAAYFDEQYVKSQVDSELQRLSRRRREYTPASPGLDPSGRVIILVDDGIATGSTMPAAVRAVRRHGAVKIVVATPVSAIGVSQRLKDLADELIALQTPWDFLGVGQYYEEFPHVGDAEVRQALRDFHASSGRAA